MKDHIRDYATNAFRFYAKLGMSTEQYKEQIRKEALETITKREGSPKSGGSPTEAMLMNAEKEVQVHIAEIMDLEAVEKTLAEFKSKSSICEKLIKEVYFTEPDKELQKGDISKRVVKAALDFNLSERSIYYELKKARTLFAYNRGLKL